MHYFVWLEHDKAYMHARGQLGGVIFSSIMWDLGIEFRSSCLGGKCLQVQPSPKPPVVNFLIKSRLSN